MEPGTRKVRNFRDLLWIALFEFIGTFIFLFGISFSKSNPVVVAGSLFIAAIITGRVGGGHYNAGVTIAVYIVERKWIKNLPIAGTIILADILGAFFGMLMAVWLEDMNTLLVLKPHSARETLFSVVVHETFFTMAFISAILHVKYSKVMPTNDGVLSTIVVTFTLFIMISMIGAETGGCFNPTIGLVAPTF